MKVVFIAFDSTELSLRLASALAEHAQVTLMLPREQAEPHLGFLSPNVDYRPFHRPRLRQAFRQVRAIARIVNDIRRLDPDVIHMQKWHLWFYLALPTLRRFPLVISIHDPFPHRGDRGAMKTPRSIIRFGYRRATRAIVHNDEMRRIVVDELGLSPESIDIVPLIERGDASLGVHIEERDNEVLFFGRIWEYKGLRYFIEAASLISAEVPSARFVIAGRGDDFAPYRAMMSDPTRFEVHNEFVSDETRAELFRRASVVVLPYCEATQSGVIPVAYTYERPVVATNVGGLASQVVDGQTGLLVAPRDARALADAVVELLADPDLRHTMGRNGRHLLEERWSASVVAEQTFEVYRMATQQAGHSR